MSDIILIIYKSQKKKKKGNELQCQKLSTELSMCANYVGRQYNLITQN